MLLSSILQKKKCNASDEFNLEQEKSITYENINDQDHALAALEKKLELLDTLNKPGEIAALSLQHKYQSSYEVKKAQKLVKTNNILKGKLEEREAKGVIPIVSASAIFLCIAMVCRRSHIKNKARLKIAREIKAKIQEQYEKDKKTNLTYKESIESKQAEITSSLVALTAIEGNITGLIAECSEKPEDTDLMKVKNDLQLLVNNKDSWKLFRKNFSETNILFQQNLHRQVPQLTKNDLFFCSLLKLRLSNKDMSALLHVSPNSIVKKKYRIKKKMDIQTDAELENILTAAGL